MANPVAPEARDALLELLGVTEPPQPRVDLPPLRPPRRLPDGAAPRPRRGRPPPAAGLPRARRLARRPEPHGAPVAAHGRLARGARGGAERRLHRRRADRADRLPQLRQPRERRDRLGARRVDRGDGAGVRGAALPIVSGNVSLYNETDGRAIDPTPVVGCVGCSRTCGACPGLARGRRDPARRRLAGRARRARSTRRAGGRSAAARPASTLRRRRRWSSSSGAPRRSARSSTTSRTAASRSRSRRPRSTPGSARSWRCPDDPRAWFGEGGGQAVLACAPEVVELLGGVPLRRSASSAARSLLGLAARRAAGGVRLMCGVFGIRSAERDVARLAYFGLFALQHRGQESAGIAVSDRGRLTVAARHGARRPGLRRGEAAGASRRGRDRAHPLLDDRVDARGRTRSRSSTTAARGRSRSATTAT